MMILPRLAIRCLVGIVGLVGLLVGASIGLFYAAPAFAASVWWTLGPVVLGFGLAGGLAAVWAVKRALRPQADFVSSSRLTVFWAGAWAAGLLLGWFLERAFGLEDAGAAVRALLLAVAGVLAVWIDEP